MKNLIILFSINLIIYYKNKILMNIIQLPKDLNNICSSYLSDDERIYVNNEWNKFNKIDICEIAAQNGWLDLLIWARQNNCEWDNSVCSYAALNGHLEVLKWARQNDCEWNSGVCSSAAEKGHLEVLKWARQNGCEWDSYVCSNANLNKHLEVLEWVKLNGCICGGKYHK